MATPTSGHGLFAGQAAVVEGVHVDDLLRFHQGRGRSLVFEPPLALEGHPQLVHHGTAEGPLRRQEDRVGSRRSPSHTSSTGPARGRALMHHRRRTGVTVLARRCGTLVSAAPPQAV